VARFVAGDVVIVPFPFTDLASSKVRLAEVLATSTRDDICSVRLRAKTQVTPKLSRSR
jgi:mRNA interferase MazF